MLNAMGAGAAGGDQQCQRHAPSGQRVRGDRDAPPCAANASVQRTLLPVPPSAQAVPALGEWALACLALVLSLLVG